MAVRFEVQALADAGEVARDVVIGVGGQGLLDEFGEGFGDSAWLGEMRARFPTAS